MCPRGPPRKDDITGIVCFTGPIALLREGGLCEIMTLIIYNCVVKGTVQRDERGTGTLLYIFEKLSLNPITAEA